jgi:hypothetical protein
MSNGYDPEKTIEEIASKLSETLPAAEARKMARELVNKQGITKIANGSCPLGGTSPMACMFCPFGHMTHCHHPLTCEEAKCSRYLQEREAAGEESTSTKELFDVECCAGTGHTVREGGGHVNLVVLNKKAHSKFLVAYDIWLDGKERPPRAVAAICDSCARERKKPLFALARDGDKTSIYRIPVAELGDWSLE